MTTLMNTPSSVMGSLLLGDSTYNINARFYLLAAPALVSSLRGSCVWVFHFQLSSVETVSSWPFLHLQEGISCPNTNEPVLQGSIRELDS